MKRILLLVVLLFLAACRQSSSHEEAVKSLRTICSWTATAQMVAQAWQQGAIPDVYAQQTLEKSQQEIAKETKDSTYNPALLASVQQSIQQMSEDIQQHRKVAIAASLQQLANEQQQLNAALKAQGETQ